jgi:O-antigen biosynthesis protein WbqP
MGKDKKPFVLYKFRTMPIDTMSMASHLIPESQVTVVGGFLRKYKLDEILQFYNVMTGDMSVVGPRPNLFNQGSVCDARDALGVYCVRPGITGWSQLRMIDMSYPMPLAETDADMISHLNIYVYFKCIFRTAIGRGFGDAN